MKYLSIVCVGAVMLAASGCANCRNYVPEELIDPVNAKLDEHGKSITDTNASLQKTNETSGE